MKKLFGKLIGLLLLSLMVAAFTVFSQAQNPVSLTMSVKPAKVKPGDKLTGQITASIGGGWHMYSVTQGAGGPIPTRITIADGAIKAAGGVRGSAVKSEMDANFGIVTETYSGSASFSVPLVVDSAAQPGAETVEASVRYQVCNDTTCLPPKTVKISAPVEIIAGTTAAVAAQTSPSPAPSASPTPSPKTSPTANANANVNANSNASTNANPANTETGTILSGNVESNLSAASTTNETKNESNETETVAPVADQSVLNNAQNDLWSFIWLAMTVGALSLLTPCVFPMVPITVSYFTNHAAGNRGGAIRDAVIYALGIILTFTALGVALAVLFGAAGINKFAASPYVNLVITGIFVAFALSLFGAFELGIPSSVLTKLDRLQRREEGKGGSAGRIVALLLMGLTFSLTSFTCTAPFVGTLLVMAAQGDWFLPVVGMLAFSTVFALPFFILALAPQLVSQLPRSGGWLNSVKVVMGLLEIAAAMKFLSNVDLVWRWNIFTRDVVLASWVAISFLIVFYLLGKIQLSHDVKTERIGALRLLTAVLFFSLGFYFLTGLFGKTLGELESFLPPMTETASIATTNNDNTVNNSASKEWITNDYNAALTRAKQENKPVFIDFTGYTCTNCRWMEANMFPKESVRREFEKFILVRLYTDGEGEPFEGFQKMQQEKFNTVALPLYAIVGGDGKTLATFPGLTRKEDEFVSFLQKGQSKFAPLAATRDNGAESVIIAAR